MNLNKTLIMGLVAFTFLIGPFSLPCAGKEAVNITWKEETLSADLVGVPLQDILEHLSKSQDIWFKVHKSVLDRKVSVHFTELSVEQGLKRILTGLDYSLEFDSNGKPAGIVIVGDKASPRAVGKSTASPRGGPGPETGGPEDVSDSFGGDETTTPFGPVTVTPEERKQFKVIKNVPPPGGLPEVTEEELKQFKVIKNAPPPGGPPTATEEELEQFKVIRNAPPPGGPLGPNP